MILIYSQVWKIFKSSALEGLMGEEGAKEKDNYRQ